MNPRRPSRAAAGAEAGDTDEDDTTARRPGRRTPTEAKPSKAPWIIGAFLVLGLAAIAAYKPVKRSMLLSELDGASGAAAIDCANRYLEFEKGRESAVRNVIADRRGTFEAQLPLAKTIVSLSCLTALADRGDLEPAQLIQVLDTGVAIYDSEQHRKERLPRETEAWISGDDRDLAIAAIGLLVRHARAGNDADEVTAQLAKIAAEPTVDPLKAKAALDGMGQLLDSDSLGHALGLLRGPAFDQVLGHAALVDAIRNSARAGNLIDLLSLSDHAHEGVRALALDCLGRLTLPDSTDPKLRADLGNRVSAKLTPTTPPVELAAALGAVKNLRLSGASESVIQLARQREALALPGIDDQFWIHCLGDAFILPHGADEANDRLVSRLAECVDDPALLPIAAAAIGRIRDPDLISLRKGLDALARHLDEFHFATLLLREARIQQISREAEDAVQGGAKLMAHIGDEEGFGDPGLARPDSRVVEFLLPGGHGGTGDGEFHAKPLQFRSRGGHLLLERLRLRAQPLRFFTDGAGLLVEPSQSPAAADKAVEQWYEHRERYDRQNRSYRGSDVHERMANFKRLANLLASVAYFAPPL